MTYRTAAAFRTALEARLKVEQRDGVGIRDSASARFFERLLGAAAGGRAGGLGAQDGVRARTRPSRRFRRPRRAVPHAPCSRR